MHDNWEIEFTEEFERWWDMLGESAQESIAHDVEVLGRFGPALGRP
ncbi:MAG TPA: diaminopimelate decarboxylase, partial [Phycisphaerales bacterium]|nr:diaminopimelate decarboxylase [Phycisphaerales bacterium]